MNSTKSPKFTEFFSLRAAQVDHTQPVAFATTYHHLNRGRESLLIQCTPFSTSYLCSAAVLSSQWWVLWFYDKKSNFVCRLGLMSLAHRPRMFQSNSRNREWSCADSATLQWSTNWTGKYSAWWRHILHFSTCITSSFQIYPHCCLVRRYVHWCPISYGRCTRCHWIRNR